MKQLLVLPLALLLLRCAEDPSDGPGSAIEGWWQLKSTSWRIELAYCDSSCSFSAADSAWSGSTLLCGLCCPPGQTCWRDYGEFLTDTGTVPAYVDFVPGSAFVVTDGTQTLQTGQWSLAGDSVTIVGSQPLTRRIVPGTYGFTITGDTLEMEFGDTAAGYLGYLLTR